jgi:hypothetical protein
MDKTKIRSLLAFVAICYAVSFISGMIRNRQLLCHAGQTVLATSELAVRSGMDLVVRTDGRGRMESLVFPSFKAAHPGAWDFRRATGCQFPLEPGLLLISSARPWLFCDCVSGDSAALVHFADMDLCPHGSIAFCSLLSVGCFATSLDFMVWRSNAL